MKWPEKYKGQKLLGPHVLNLLVGGGVEPTPSSASSLACFLRPPRPHFCVKLVYIKITEGVPELFEIEKIQFFDTSYVLTCFGSEGTLMWYVSRQADQQLHDMSYE